MAEPRYLVDTSVLARAPQQGVGDRLEALARAGQLWSCRLIDLEVIYGTRARDVDDVIDERMALPEASITPTVMNRAIQMAKMLAAAGHHRGAKPSDLIIAAAAEFAGLTVLHYDDDYDRISAVTHQATEWVAPRGSLDR
ncbi:MAG TPA: PIN domain-containing protein [Vicinamibacteria bacterium]|nr:PIN domain-containing protein [Vicinamibacteria bacterium]